MALQLYRRQGESLTLFIDPQTSPEELHRRLQAGISIKISDISPGKVDLAITAPKCVHIIRPERFSQEEWLERSSVRPWWRKFSPNWLYQRIRTKPEPPRVH